MDILDSGLLENAEELLRGAACDIGLCPSVKLWTPICNRSASDSVTLCIDSSAVAAVTFTGRMVLEALGSFCPQILFWINSFIMPLGFNTYEAYGIANR